MNLAQPFELVTPTLDGDLLAVLARAESSFTIGQIAGLVGHASVSGLRKALGRLSRQGIVSAQRTPAAVLYSLNRRHLAAEAILFLANLRTHLIERMATDMRQWPTPPAYAALFGSAARGDMSPESDIDTFVLRPRQVAVEDKAWRDGVDSFTAKVASWTGNDVRIFEVGVSDVNAADPLIKAVAAEGLTLVGERSEIQTRQPKEVRRG